MRRSGCREGTRLGAPRRVRLIPSAGIQVVSKLIIIGPLTRLLAYPFLLRLHPRARRRIVRLVLRAEVELTVEVHGDDAVAALFALVIMALSPRLRPPGSLPASLPCCSP